MSNELEYQQAQPKVDLHRHLEGSLRLDTMHEVVSRFDLDLPSNLEALRALVQVGDEDARDARTFLTKFKVIRQFFKSDDILQRFTQEVIEDAAADGVRALELRFTPAALTEFSSLTLTDVSEIVLHAGREAANKHQITLGFIVSINRHEPLELAEKVVRIAVDGHVSGISGIDLAGDEASAPVDPFVPLFAEAKQAGLKLTIHAGEWGGPENVAQAIDTMAADRIGHGVRVMEDAGVLHLARSSKVGFEVSPTSNIRTGVFDQLNAHPLSSMIDAGLFVAITTDDPAIFDTTLSQEHARVIAHQGLSNETIKGLTMQAIQLSFFHDKDKRALEKAFTNQFWNEEG